MTRIAIPLAFLLSMILGIATAEAGKVVVLRVAGDPEGELEDGLMSIIEDRHDLVTSGEFERAARKSGLDDLDGKALAKLARKLGADALIEGVVSREDEGFLLVVKIRGKNGKIVKKVSVDLAKPRLSSKAKKRVGTVVLDGIDMVLGIAPESDRDDEDDGEIEMDEEERPKKKAKTRKETNRGKRGKAKAERAAAALADDEDRPRRKSRDDDEEDEEDEEENQDEDEEGDDEENEDDEDRVAFRDDDDELSLRDDDEDDDSPRRKSPHMIARVEAGPSAKLRTLAFNSREFDQAPRGYKSSMVPGARVAGEAYPLALRMDGPASNLGIGFEYDQTIGMTTRSSDAPTVNLPTIQKHWDVGARYRIPFGKKPTAPMVIAGAGIGHRFFIVDRSTLPAEADLDMPDVAYKYYHAGATFRMPIGARATVQAGGRAMMFSSAGSISDTDQYGGAKLTGLDASAGVEVKITPQAFVSLAGSFTQIGFAFVGNGEETNNRDLDPTTQDVGGASDRYIGFVGTVGYVY